MTKLRKIFCMTDDLGAPIFISVCFFEVSMAEYTRNEVNQMKYHRDTYHV